MAGVVGEEVVKMLYNAAAEGDVNTIQYLLQQDPYLLDLVSFPCSRNLLHIAAMHGQLNIAELILRKNPHLPGGQIDYTSELQPCAHKMMWSSDSQGMNPIHVAAMHGHAKMLRMLVEVDSAPAKERMDRGQTALHLCVKHGHADALMVLVDMVGELVIAKDDDGDTPLHFAVRYNRIRTMIYLLESNTVVKKSKNSKGGTARDIVEESFPSRTSGDKKIMIEVLTIREAFFSHDEILGKMSDMIMVVAVLIATMAYQSAISPPGGVWQEDSPQHTVMASHHPELYKKFVGANTTAFLSSLISILLISTDLPSDNIFLFSMVIYGVWLSFSYGACLTVITPHMGPQSLDKVIYIVVGVSIGLFALLFIGVASGSMVGKAATRLLEYPGALVRTFGRRLPQIPKSEELAKYKS